ncbi:MAG: PEP-CTERM sorting domain-containing protein [Thauera phenolivorans]|uniref:PEP-CTERM sorting domain-containing protein n=1 Tax=Thauera phenolivorans TaxID=1792543 RepID=A0A7X7R8J1_9RHOO|nr:PEP-CTERM sorting domain-containing protein [Thauera phenolivorans]
MISLTENSRRIVRAVACALAASLLPAVASATVLYEQAPIDDGESYESVVSSSLQSADDFTLSNTQWVGGFDWWGVEAATEAFLIRIFDTTEGGASPVFACGYGVVGCGLTVDVTPTTLLDSWTYPIFRYSVDLADAFEAAANTRYLLSISNEDELSATVQPADITVEAPDYANWYWLSGGAGDDGSSYLRAGDDQDWIESPPDFAFAVRGVAESTPVPEPASLMLLGVAGLGAMFATRRRRTGD